MENFFCEKKNFFFSRGDLEGRGSQGEVGGDMWSPGSSIQEILEDQYCEERKETSKEMRKWREKNTCLHGDRKYFLFFYHFSFELCVPLLKYSFHGLVKCTKQVRQLIS